MSRLRFRTLRGRLTAVALLVAVVAIGGLTIAFNLLLAGSLNGDADSRLRAQAAAAATTVRVSDGRVRLARAPEDGAVDRSVWVYEGTRAIERAPGDGELQRAADALAGESHAFDDLPEERQVRLYALPIRDDGRQVGTIVAAQSTAAYDRTTDLAQVGSLVLALVLLAAVFLTTRQAIGRALAPVRTMVRDAAAWSEHEPGRRFGADERPDELGELASTFDALLDRVAASLRHEQRLSAELSHELRTPLSRIVAEAELLRRRDRPLDERREAYDSIVRSAGQMSDILETLMAAARADAGLDRGRGELGAVMAELADTWGPVCAARGVELTVAAPGAPVSVGVDGEVVRRILAPVLDNAARHARGHVAVTTGTQDGQVTVVIADDGPGIPAEALQRVFEPGVRLADGDGHGGSGLGLPLARRLARAAGGDVAATAPEDGGARFVVRLPR
ncbi:MAG TPA: HAMP domain-containing sensor histidine kinase [Baekduia sp.]|jgi:signal transduction histidine kinase